MKVRFSVRDPAPLALDGLDLLVVPVAGDRRPLRGLAGACDWELCGELSETMQDERFTGARGDRLLVHTEGRLPMRFVLLLGIGRYDHFGPGELMPFFRALARVLDGAQASSFGLSLGEFAGPVNGDMGAVSNALFAGLFACFPRDDVDLWLLYWR